MRVKVVYYYECTFISWPFPVITFGLVQQQPHQIYILRNQNQSCFFLSSKQYGWKSYKLGNHIVNTCIRYLQNNDFDFSSNFLFFTFSGLVDVLDTLAIMGNKTEFQKAVKLVLDHVSFDKPNTGKPWFKEFWLFEIDLIRTKAFQALFNSTNFVLTNIFVHTTFLSWS